MDNKRQCKRHPPETWRQARDAYALGATLKDIATQYGIAYYTLREKARTESWPTPDKLPPPSIPAAQIAADSLASRGERHRLRIAELVEQALAAALPPALNNWSDIAIAAKLGNTALGLDAPAAPVVSLTFPASSSTESAGYIDISTKYSPNARRDPLPEGLPLPHATESDHDQ